MKQIFLLLAVTTLLFSCKKDQTNDPDSLNDPSLQAYFRFSANYDDVTGKANGVSQSSGNSFGTDRKGNPNSALHVDGTGGAALKNIFQKGKASSLSIWIAKDELAFNFINPIIDGSSFTISQENETIMGAVSHPATNAVSVNCPDRAGTIMC